MPSADIFSLKYLRQIPPFEAPIKPSGFESDEMAVLIGFSSMLLLFIFQPEEKHI